MDKSKTIDHKEVVDQNEKTEVALREEAILSFWQEHDIFNKSVNKEAPNGDFVFYDGPPFATGLPHYGHILAGTIKDAIPRFWTMNGYRVRRQWGWDCHGLPLENLIEKQLGLSTKRDIEEYGVKNFNEAARGTVMEYASDWRRIIPRMGRWADMDNDYKTMDSTYTESVWWVFSELNRKGLVYEGFKNMHLCPRCGTTLSNFEVNLGYKDIKDIAVTVKLPLLDDADQPTDTSLLVWTTTPWTLPGNMAASVHRDVDYVKVKFTHGDVNVSVSGDIDFNASKFEYVILAKARLIQLETLDGTYEIVEEFKGSELVGKSYEPPFDYWQKQEFANKENAWKIYHADYVEIGDEGTGAVHLAPAYGEDDMNLAKEHNIPIEHHVDESGHFKSFVTDFAGQLVKPKDDEAAEVSHLDADIEIVKALKEKGKLFRKENITHSYPHCWRCDTPLLNYATTSWFVRVTDIRDKLVAENKKVHWVPEHIGMARFGKWLEGARDWAVSRQRYWGAPLPIWRNPNTKEYKVLGSLAELQSLVPKSGNTYYTMRHGESTKNTKDVVTSIPDAPYPLTEKGKKEAQSAAQSIEGGIDLIITSPVLRAVETAEIVAKELGLAKDCIISDKKISEAGCGELEEKPVQEYRRHFPKGLSRFTDRPKGVENWTDIKQRVGSFLYNIEESYQNKRILIISHGDPLALLHAAAKGWDQKETYKVWDAEYPETGLVKELPFTPMPHNDNYELDYHRPYIDEFEVFDEDGTKLERVPDVFDCWFESGSMPYAQHHYPFAFDHKNVFTKELFPANFIAESVDQTRGWFYSLIVLGVALFDKSPYENVITNGLVLAEDGRKMSKSLQNYPDPMELADRQGADSMRYYLLSSSIIRGEDLNFSEKEVAELQRKNIGRLHNVLSMYEMFADGTTATADSKHVLDRWIVSRLNQLVTDATAGFKNYELDKATRPITEFIDDLSVWYLRRSRDRLKGKDETDRQSALATLRHVLRTLSLVMAPSMPFYSEYLWSRVKEDSDPESVHLASWPEAQTVDPVVIGEMSLVREFVTLALEARTKAGIKVRQPLPKLTINIELKEEYADVVADEINVKEIVADTGLSERAVLDTEVTPELKLEGNARELMRAIQDLRKQAGLNAKDQVVLMIQTSDGGEAVIKAYESEIKDTVGADSIMFSNASGEDLQFGDHEATVELKKL